MQPIKRLQIMLALGVGLMLVCFWTLADPPIVRATAWLCPLTTQHSVGGACGATIQACINAAAPGDTVNIPAGTYVESLLLNKAVSLTGVNSATT